MMKGMYRVALMLGLVAFSAVSVDAAELTETDDPTAHEIRVVNNYQTTVRVYAEDAEGKLHQLGRVARGHFKVLELSDEISRMGDVRLKIFPTPPAWSLADDDFGIRTKDLRLEEGAAVNVYLETDLKQSMIQVEKG